MLWQETEAAATIQRNTNLIIKEVMSGSRVGTLGAIHSYSRPLPNEQLSQVNNKAATSNAPAS
jgi:hypothetical protein